MLEHVVLAEDSTSRFNEVNPAPDMGSGEVIVISDEDIVADDRGKKRKRVYDQVQEIVKERSEAEPPVLKLLCWNIDGLCERGLSERFSAVISQIKQSSPHVVLLQEVVEEHLKRIKSQLGASYHIFPSSGKNPFLTGQYANYILIRKNSRTRIETEEWMPFQGSKMGRHLVSVKCFLLGRWFVFYTSHIESLKDQSVERVTQVEDVLKRMSSGDKESIVLFGGDTNLRDSEMKRIKLPGDIRDAWEEVGRDTSTRYTWDTIANNNTNVPFKCRLRFDRVFYRSSPYLMLESFQLVGKERLLSCDMFPSDHWGISATFRIS